MIVHTYRGEVMILRERDLDLQRPLQDAINTLCDHNLCDHLLPERVHGARSALGLFDAEVHLELRCHFGKISFSHLHGRFVVELRIP